MPKDTKQDGLSDEKKVALGMTGVTGSMYVMNEIFNEFDQKRVMEEEERLRQEQQRIFEEEQGKGGRANGSSNRTGGNYGRNVAPDVEVVEDPYAKYKKSLGLKPNATEEEIEKAFRKALLQNHPDRGGSKEFFQRLNNEREAFKIDLSKYGKIERADVVAASTTEPKNQMRSAEQSQARTSSTKPRANTNVRKPIRNNRLPTPTQMKQDHSKALTQKKAITKNNALVTKKKAYVKPKAQVKKPAPQLSWWKRAKNKAKGLYNKAKTAYKTTKGKVSKALDKTWVGRKVKKVVRPFVKAGEWVAKKHVQMAKSTYKKVIKPAARYVKNSRFGKAAAKYGPKALKLGGKTLKWCSKRLPVVCTVVGGVEAVYYLYKGEYAKAAFAATSAVAGNFPPVGTVIGIAAEAGLVGIDYYNSKQQEKAQQAAAQQAQMRQQQAQQQQKTNANTREINNGPTTQAKDEVQQTSSIRDAIGAASYDRQPIARSDNQQTGPQTNQPQVQQTETNQPQVQQTETNQPQAQQPETNQPQVQQSQTYGQQQTDHASSTTAVSKGDEIVVSYGDDQKYTISKEDLKARMVMSSRRAKGTMEKLQDALSINPNAKGVIKAVESYVPELKNDSKGTAKVNRNLVDSTVKTIGGSSKATSITIDGKKIKAKDIQESYGCSKKEAKKILKAYGRAIEDGANLDDVLRDIASGKKLDATNQTPANNNDTSNQAPANNNMAMRAMMARRIMRDFS